MSGLILGGGLGWRLHRLRQIFLLIFKRSDRGGRNGKRREFGLELILFLIQPRDMIFTESTLRGMVSTSEHVALHFNPDIHLMKININQSVVKRVSKKRRQMTAILPV
jgi:hypothetical protein